MYLDVTCISFNEVSFIEISKMMSAVDVLEDMLVLAGELGTASSSAQQQMKIGCKPICDCDCDVIVKCDCDAADDHSNSLLNCFRFIHESKRRH